MRRVALAFLSLWLACGGAPAWTAPSPDGPGVRRALLIGINRYKAVPSLQGSVNDIETMREVLVTRYGFEPHNIAMLTDEFATRDAIVADLERLVDLTGAADTVYLHYSGHGSQVENLSGDEADHLDETLVPQDGRSGTVRDIIDDELAVIVARLRARSAVIVLDSCHSGTATRALDIRTRSVPQDTRIDLYRQATRTRAIVPMMSSRYVVLSATAENQEALDGPIDGRYQGFFTYALARTLSNAPPGQTLRETFEGVARELSQLQARFGRTSMPEPQLEAPPALLSQPLFTALGQADPQAPAAQEPALPWLALRPMTPQVGLLIKATLLGAAPGSKWAIYPPGETQFRPGAAVGVATVDRIEGADAFAQLETAGPPLEPGSRAVALMPPPAPTRVPVRLLEMSPEQRAQVSDLLSRDIVKVVGQNDPAQFLVQAQGSQLNLLSADGLHVVGQFQSSGPTASLDLSRFLMRASNAAEILSLDNAASRISISARVANRPSLQQRGIAVVADTSAPRLHIRRSGEARTPGNSLQLEVRVSQASYVTIVDVDSEGGVNLLFPNEVQATAFHPQGLVEARQTLVVPDSLQPGNRAGFYWDYSPPSGIDTIRVFASAELATAQLIRDRIRHLRRDAAATLGDSAARGVADSLRTLRQSLARSAARGIDVVADPNAPSPSGGSSPAGDWAATSVTVEVSN